MSSTEQTSIPFAEQPRSRPRRPSWPSSGRLTAGLGLLGATLAVAAPNLAMADELAPLRSESISVAAAISQGLYAIPYEPGTSVKVTRDHISHTPANRIDMHGTSGGPYRVTAAAHGTVRFIEDSHNVNGGCENNNYVWIEHDNGEWTKYSHIEQYSASSDAGLSVGDYVMAGQFLGIEGNIGCASGDHVHFEVAIPDDPADPINPVGGYIKGDNLIPRVCGIDGQLFVAGTTYVVPDVRPGYDEYARHLVSHGSFQSMFNAATDCGYRLEWNDGFDRNGTAYFNALFRPSVSGLSWRSHRMLTEQQLDDYIDQYVDEDGYSLVHIDAYSVGSAVRYAAIFERSRSTPDTVTYHGLSAAQHQGQFDALTAAGYRPRQVSVASVNGVRTYAAIYTYGSIGSYMVRSFQTSADYQTNYTANKDAGRRLIYLNSYVHNGEPRYTAIWASSAPTYIYARHGLSTTGYQDVWQSVTGAGWTTEAVTAFHLNGVTSFAAYWSY
ncbi:peptidoglycan DD-metalloendopeptidase family protein [Haliangium sp.]|uniref:peptidoglycan DD-metalloendopeptidase family protein n=1 Tax=Haliangium sp. TaxID=2663208 RepID=UPI003D10C4C0